MPKKFIATTVVLIAASVSPIIPQEMELAYSISYNPATIAPTSATSTDPVKGEYITALEAVPDEDGDGLVSVSVFIDRKGNKVIVPIDEARYAKMGEKDGQKFNPQKDEYISAVEALTPKAEAAIAFDSAPTNMSDSGGNVASLTYAFNNVAGNTCIFYTSNYNSLVYDITSQTYNGTPTILATTTANIVSGGVASGIRYLHSCPTGTNNVVTSVSPNRQLYGGAVSYSGTDGTTASPYGTTGTNNAASATVTTNGNVPSSCWVVGAAQNSAQAMTLSTGVNAERTTYPTTRYTSMGDSNGTVTAGSPYSMTWTVSVNGPFNTLNIVICEPSSASSPKDNGWFQVL